MRPRNSSCIASPEQNSKLDWQTGIRCTSLRFGDHPFAQVDTYNPAFGSDEPYYFERIIAGPACNIEHALLSSGCKESRIRRFVIASSGFDFRYIEKL